MTIDLIKKLTNGPPSDSASGTITKKLSTTLYVVDFGSNRTSRVSSTSLYSVNDVVLVRNFIILGKYPESSKSSSSSFKV